MWNRWLNKYPWLRWFDLAAFIFVALFMASVIVAIAWDESYEYYEISD